MKKTVVLMIDFYRNTLSMLSIGTCRFYPSCSVYTKEAVLKYGALKGLVLGIKRIMRCNQLNPGGFDPIP